MNWVGVWVCGWGAGPFHPYTHTPTQRFRLASCTDVEILYSASAPIQGGRTATAGRYSFGRFLNEEDDRIIGSDDGDARPAVGGGRADQGFAASGRAQPQKGAGR